MIPGPRQAGVGHLTPRKGRTVLIPASGAPIQVEVDLREPEVVDGSPLHVRILATADEDATVTRCEVVLVQKVAYQYNQSGMFTVISRSSDVVAQTELPGWGPMIAGEVVGAPVALAVPANSLGTTTSKLIEITWEVRVTVHLDSTATAGASTPLVVLARALDCARAAVTPPRAVDRRLARLSIERLASRRLVPGVAVSGVLGIAPSRPWTARSAQVALIRREHVERGPWVGTDPTRNPAHEQKDAETVVAQQTLAEGMALDPSRPQQLSFLLTAPRDLGAASMGKPEFRVDWVLRASLGRALRANPFIEVDLHAATTPAAG